MSVSQPENPQSAAGLSVEAATEVRYGETDQMGCAHHAAAVLWFELGRVQWLRRHGLSYRALEESGFLLPVVDLRLRYHAPGRFEDALIIQTTLAGIERSRVFFESQVLRAESSGERTLLVSGAVQLVCLDRAERRITRLPPALAALWERLRSSRENSL